MHLLPILIPQKQFYIVDIVPIDFLLRWFADDHQNHCWNLSLNLVFKILKGVGVGMGGIMFEIVFEIVFEIPVCV